MTSNYSRDGRFVAGASSPNPSGRPRLTLRAKFKRMLDLVLSEYVLVREKDRTRRITKFEALIRQLVYKAASSNGSAKAHRLLEKMQRQTGVLAPEPAEQQPCGVLVVERYQSPEEWEAYWSSRRAPIDPLEGLPGIDREALARAIAAKQRMQEHGYEDREDDQER